MHQRFAVVHRLGCVAMINRFTGAMGKGIRHRNPEHTTNASINKYSFSFFSPS
jgi:hypothetical protein